MDWLPDKSITLLWKPIHTIMHIENNTSYLLFIEPKNKSTDPIIDTYTRKMAGALRSAQKGLATYRSEEPYFFIYDGGYKGIHTCECGHASSSNQDYLITTKDSSVTSFLGKDGRTGNIEGATPIQAVITNSLCIHYVACHRDEIPQEVLDQILLLEGEEVEPTTHEIQPPQSVIAS